ncbi:3-hydroxyisobutyrate dehydrogenase [Ochrobactrum intermedium]|uniref:3-hydroxyisobutyrate dehydrogenase n=1 Tax=Brucella intermedia TaxID=94625 RepID=A0ABR6AVI9_9HYPH|nr:3-hydroxyisobutyrate dehydrogenase [Brucella intermedia]
MTRISFIGTGNMGEPMAENIAKAGHPVKIYDADPQKAATVAQRIGAVVAASLAEVADCDICITMLPTSTIVQDVLVRAQDGGFLNNARSGMIVIDMSSSEPGKTRETGKLLANKGIVMIDAPVSGGMVRAQSGTLAIMIGSDNEDAVQTAMPVLELMGKQIFRVGPLGAGDVMKAANNFVAAACYAATAEAISMGKTFGLDPKMMMDIINVSTGRSFSGEVVVSQHVVTGKYASGFALALLTKDVGIAAKMGEELDMDTPLVHLVHHRYKQALEKVGTASDNSEAIRGWYEKLWEK